MLLFPYLSFYVFFAAEGAVAWDIALSLEIPTVDGKRLMIPDDNINLEVVWGEGGKGGGFRKEFKIFG